MNDLMIDLENKINEADKKRNENPEIEEIYNYLLELKKDVNIMIKVGVKSDAFEELLEYKDNIYNDPKLEIVSPYFNALEFLTNMKEEFYKKEEIYKYIDEKIDEYEQLGKYKGIKNNKL